MLLLVHSTATVAAMLLRPLRRLQPLRHLLHPNPNPNPFVAHSIAKLKHSFSASSSSASFVDLPKPRRSSDRKPLVTPITELKRRAREERKARHEVREVALRPPENGLLVQTLVPVAHEVFAARKQLLCCAERVAGSIPVHACRYVSSVS